MALNVDKNRQLTGYTNTPTAQPKAAQPAASSKPIDFSSKNNNYTVKKGDTLWGLAKQQLIASGIARPNNTQIIEAMQKIASANGCSSVDECAKKFFYTIGNQLNLQGLFEAPKPEPVVEENTTEPELPVLTEQETKIKEELKTKFPNLGLENMTDNEVKAFLDKLKETNPDLLSALETAVSAAATEEAVPTEGVEEPQAQTTGLTDEQTKALKEQLNQYITENPDVVTERSTTPHPTVAKSEMEQLAEKIGIEGDIDGIIAKLKEKDEKDLTADETKLLQLYDAQNKSLDEAQSIDEQKMLAMVKGLLDNGFMELSPEQQISMTVDQYLTKYDETYKNLATEEDKKAYLEQKIALLNNLAAPTDANSGLKAQFADNITSIRTMLLLQIAEKKGISIDDLKNIPEAELKEMLRNSENAAVSAGFKLINEQIGDKLDNVSEEEKVNVYADAVLNLLDKNYASITDEKQKAQYRDNMIMTFAKQIMGESSNINIEKILNDPVRKKELYLKVSYALDYIANGKDGDFVSRIEEFDISNAEGLNAVMMKAIESRQKRMGDKFSAEDAARLTKTKNYDDMIQMHKKLHGDDATTPTNKDALEAVNAMLRNAEEGQAPEEVLNDLKEWKAELEREAKLNPNGICRVRLSLEEQADVEGKTLFDKYAEVVDGLEPGTEAFDQKIKITIKEKIGSVKDIRGMIEFLKQKGYSEEQIQDLINAEDALGPDAYAHIIAKPPTAEDRAFLERLSAKAQNGDLGEIKNKVASDIYNPNNGFGYSEEENTLIAGAMANDVRLQPAIQNGVINNSSSKEQAAQRFTDITNSDQLADANKATFNQTLISETLTNDEDRLFYAQYISENTNNSAALEGIAAASNSVSDPGIKQQYNTTVTTAAKKYPPESQSNINYALETGNVSPSTKAKTTPPVSSSSSSSAYNYSSAATTSSQKAISSSSTAKTTAATSSSASYTTSGLSQSYTVKNTDYKRQAAMDNAKSTAQSIEEAVKDWETKHSKKLSVDDIDTVKAAAALDAAREAVESSATSDSEKERILKALANATSVGEIYDILVGALGAARVQDKFIEALAMSGSTTNIKAFVASRAGDNDSLVKQIFLRTSSSSLRKELIGMMSSDTIAELLANKQITDLSTVDQRILIRYAMKNIFLMSNTEFVRFLNAIADPNEKEKLIAMRTGVNQLKNNKKQSLASSQNDGILAVETAGTSDAPTVMPSAQIFAAASTESSAPEQEEPLVQPTAPNRLAAGEISRDLGNGTILTREGAGFGAISNVDFDLAHVVEKPKSKDGAPIGMNDDTLTVGSAEWNKKYNKNNVQSTAFTLASLEEEFGDEGFGGVWGGTSGNFKGKTPAKKLHKGLKFNA